MCLFFFIKRFAQKYNSSAIVSKRMPVPITEAVKLTSETSNTLVSPAAGTCVITLR